MASSRRCNQPRDLLLATLALWPFSLGSKDEAFLGTTFGMSREEVTRALKKYHAQLVDYDSYMRVSGDYALIHPFDFTPILNSDERDVYSLYMPSIQMFGAVTKAEFEFQRSRLQYVAAHFMNEANSASVVSSLTSALEKHYVFVGRENSKGVPGAYTLHFKSASVAPSLWVNLTDPKKPVIILSILRSSDESDRQKRIQQREQSAFGR